MSNITNPSLKEFVSYLKTHASNHTALFNVAAYTLIGLSKDDHTKVYDYIECTINGDGLYEGASRETILQAYHAQELSEVYGLNWVDHISVILEELDLTQHYIKHSSKNN